MSDYQKNEMKVLIIMGHPRKDSYCAALAQEYARGAREAGVSVEYLALTDLLFETNVVVPSPQYQRQEDDLTRAQALIKWSDHLVFVYPTWWGNMPALLKGFLDRVITPGFGFREIQADAFEKLLSPRSAQIITTMDTPVLIDRIIHGAPSVKALSSATLKFCGVRPVRIMKLSPIKHSSAGKKQQWLDEAYQKGRALERGVLSSREKLLRRISPWIQAIRLQFYPMTFFAYGIGAFIYSYLSGGMNWFVFIWGYMLLFLIEVLVVFTNDLHDRETDRLNRFFSPFSGGSRVLVNGLITESRFKQAIRRLLMLTGILAIGLAWFSPSSFFQILLVVGILYVIALSYTVPPLKLSYRGWGEVVVGFTHSFAVILCGFLFQGGGLQTGLPWLLSIPLFLSIIPANILAGIPDYAADKQAGKSTLVVRLGKNRASYLAITLVILSVITVLIFNQQSPLDQIYGPVIYLAVIHAVYLVLMIYRFLRKTDKPDRIDGIMAVALSYIMWFALLPFIKLA